MRRDDEQKQIRTAYRAERRAARKSYRVKKRDARMLLREKKLAYRTQKRGLRGGYRTRLERYYATDAFRKLANPPRRSVLNEIGNAVSHGIGSGLSIAALVLMLLRADTAAERVAACIYFLGLSVMFTMSCLYHAFRWGARVKRVFRRFDYSSIYLLIGATFTPILLCYIGGVYGIVFCAVQWTIIAAGIAFVGVFGPSRLRRLHIPLYVILGWSGLVFLPKMITQDRAFFFWILGGGVLYTLGIIPFAWDKKISHFLWHLFVLGGAVVQWFGIYLFIYL